MNKAIENKKAVIYCRVSTKEQVEEGNSLVSQERVCHEYAVKEGYEVVEVYVEKGESAKTSERTELKRLMAFCTSKKGNAHAVIAYKVDRISRNIADYSQIRVLLKKYGVEIKSVTEYFEDTPAGRFMENIIANVGQFDNDVRAERSIGGMREAILEGRYVWKAPPGFSNVKINGKCTIAPNDNAPLIKEVFEQIALRRESVEEIRLKMTKKGLVTNLGSQIKRSYFFLLIRNPLYKAKIKKFGKVFEGAFDPIVPEELFDEVQAILNGKTRKVKHYLHENPDFPLRRFVINENGKQLSGYWAKGRRLKYPYYSFGLPGTTIRKEILEEKYINFLGQYAFNDSHLNIMRNALIKHFKTATDIEQNGQVTIEKRIVEINTKIDNLIDLESRGSIGIVILQDRLKKFECELTDLKALLKSKECQNVDIDQLMEFATIVLKNPGTLWKKCPFEKQKWLQRFDFSEGVVFDGQNFRTTKICSIFKVKEEIERSKSIKVPSDYARKNTVSKTTIPPSKINLLEMKRFWEQVAEEIRVLQRFLDTH